MPTLNECISQYKNTQTQTTKQLSIKEQEAEITRKTLLKLKDSFNDSYFATQDIIQVLQEVKPSYKNNRHLCYQWIRSQVKRKLLYQVSFINRSSMYRIIFIPDEGVCKLSNDDKKEIETRFYQIEQEVKPKKKEVEENRQKQNVELAYQTGKEEKYIPEGYTAYSRSKFLEQQTNKESENQIIEIEEKEEEDKQKPTFSSLCKILNDVGTVQISTEKELNKYYHFTEKDELTINLKLENSKETITLSTKGTRLQILQKIINILESSK